MGSFADIGLVGGRNRHLGLMFGGELGNGSQDGVRTVGVDQVDEGPQVAPGRIVGGSPASRTGDLRPAGEHLSSPEVGLVDDGPGVGGRD